MMPFIMIWPDSVFHCVRPRPFLTVPHPTPRSPSCQQNFDNARRWRHNRILCSACEATYYSQTLLPFVLIGSRLVLILNPSYLTWLLTAHHLTFAFPAPSLCIFLPSITRILRSCVFLLKIFACSVNKIHLLRTLYMVSIYIVYYNKYCRIVNGKNFSIHFSKKSSIDVIIQSHTFAPILHAKYSDHQNEYLNFLHCYRPIFYMLFFQYKMAFSLLFPLFFVLFHHNRDFFHLRSN